MEAWFEEMGDQIPNRGGKEIHLELVQKLEIYEEYRNACISVYKDGPDNFLSYAKFVDVWEKLFPNVKIRVYKQVQYFSCSI